MRHAVVTHFVKKQPLQVADNPTDQTGPSGSKDNFIIETRVLTLVICQWGLSLYINSMSLSS